MGLMDELIIESEDFFVKVNGINKKVKVKPIGAPLALRWSKNKPDDIKSMLWLRTITSNVNAYVLSKSTDWSTESEMNTYAIQYYRIEN